MSFKKKQAFTLTELLVVVIVIGVLSAVVLPKFNKVIETRKTTEAEELMSAVRTEQERRCALDKNYLADLSKLTDVLPSSNTKNFSYSVTSTGIEAQSKGKYGYTLKMPSYRDGRVCCDSAEQCAKLNKDYPLCSDLIAYADYQSGAECAGEIEPKECVGAATQTCGCKGKGTQTRTCNTATGQWGAWSECTAPTVCECTGTKPNTSTTCNGCGTKTRTVTCDTSTGNWQTGRWSECDKEVSDCGPCPDGFERNEWGTCEASCLDWCGVSKSHVYNGPRCRNLNTELGKLYPEYETPGFEMEVRGYTNPATYREGQNPRDVCAFCNTQYSNSKCLAMYSLSADGKWTKIRDRSSIADHPTCSCPLCPNGKKSKNKQYPGGGTVEVCEEDCPPGEERDPNNGDKCRKVYNFVPVLKNVLVNWRWNGNPSNSLDGLTYMQNSSITYYLGGSMAPRECGTAVEGGQSYAGGKAYSLNSCSKLGTTYTSGQEVLCRKCSKYSPTCSASCLNDSGFASLPSSLVVRRNCSQCLGFSSANGECVINQVVQGSAYFCEAQEQ